jgi:hypothetical protein
MSSVNERMFNSIQKEFKDLKADTPKKVELDLSDIQKFVKSYVKIPEKAGPDATQDMWFRNRPWLNQLYHDENPRIILVKGRQMEASEWVVNWLFYHAIVHPGKYVYATASGQKADIFSRDRWQKQLKRSPALMAQIQSMAVHETILNKSEVYFMSAYEDTEALRSIDADAVVLDEFQSYRVNAIPIAEAGMSHSSFRRMLVVGTPLLTGSGFSNLFEMSDMKEFNTVTKEWKATNPKWDGQWSGYHISQEFAVGVPLTYNPDGSVKQYWITPEEFDFKRKHSPSAQEFQNEVLGRFFAGLGRPTDRVYMETLFSPMLTKGTFGQGETLLAGVDWGLTKSNTIFTVIRPRLLELPDIYTIDVIYVEKIDESDLTLQVQRVSDLLKRFPVTLCVCDEGVGQMQNQLLWKQWKDRVIKIQLMTGFLTQPLKIEPTQYGSIIKANRTYAIDLTMDYITNPSRFRFYNEPDEQMRNYIVNDILAEYPELTETTDKKVWRHNTDTTDDALMSLVNAIVGFQITKGSAVPENVNEWLGWA